LADAARIRDDLALKNIQAPGQDMAATVRSSQPFEATGTLRAPHQGEGGHDISEKEGT